MSDFQVKAETEIKKLAEELKLTADFAYNFSNHGWIYFRDGFTTKGSLFVSFQSDQSSFAFAKGNRQAQYFGDNDRIWLVYQKNTEEFLDIISYIRFVFSQDRVSVRNKKLRKK